MKVGSSQRLQMIALLAASFASAISGQLPQGPAGQPLPTVSPFCQTGILSSTDRLKSMLHRALTIISGMFKILSGACQAWKELALRKPYSFTVFET